VNKQQAITRNLHFVLTYASFKPIKADEQDKLLKAFDHWMRSTGKNLDFLVWSVAIKGHVNE
jgi:hypothetical protein